MSDDLATQTRILAQHLVADCAPAELPHFPEIYQDLEGCGEADISTDRRHGMGPIPTEVWTLLIVPLAGSLVRRSVDWSIDGICAWIRERRGGKGDPKDKLIAEAAVRYLQEQNSSSAGLDH